RKFSIGVASVAVASLFMGSVVHATENEGITQVATSSNMANKSQTEHMKAAKQVDEYIETMIQLDRRKHTQNVGLLTKLSAIKTEYLRELSVLKEKSEAELTSKTKEELMSKTKEKLTAAFEKFKKDTLKPGEKVAEAKKKVEEAKKKAEDQKEEDRRNYPTNTYKTLELEIAEFDVKVKEAELELLLLKEEAKESRNEEKIKQAKAKVESKQAEVTRLEEIKTERKKAEEEAKRKADAKLKEANVATLEQDKSKKRTKRGVLGEPATPDKKENDAKSSDSSVGEET
ncbi:RICH domain-containing protein, partial [Streptococcus pneumoniae]|nr:RICH domain-containing protein [Streptococcus pneumoniae]